MTTTLKPLEHILATGLDATERQTHQLRGGLILVFYPRVKGSSRIVATRKGSRPSMTELNVIRRDLLNILAELPLVVVGEFEAVDSIGSYSAAQLYINFPRRSDED